MKVRNATGKQKWEHIYMESKDSSKVIDLGQAIKRRLFVPTEQGKAWKNENMRSGEPGEGWTRYYGSKLPQKRVREGHMLPLHEAEESYHTLVVSTIFLIILRH